MRARSEALQAFYRVLGPGGRISMFEPVNVLMCDPDRLRGYDITPVKLLAVKLLADKLGALYESVRPPGVNPMLDFDERDLVRHAGQAGFADIDLQLRVMKNDPGHRS